MHMETYAPPTLMPGDRLLGLSELKRIYPKSTSSIYAEIRAGQFPAPVRIGANRVAWVERLVLQRLNHVISAADAGEVTACERA